MANATTSRFDSDLDAQSPAADLVRVYLNGIGGAAQYYALYHLGL